MRENYAPRSSTTALAGIFSAALLTTICDAGARGNGILSHWRCDETRGAILHDSVGAHDATIAGSPAFVPGVAGGAISFSRATNDVANAGNVLGFAGGADFSVSLWVRFPTGVGADQYLVSKHYTGYPNGWIVFVGVSGGCYGDPSAATFYTANVCGDEVTATTPVYDGQWHHITCTYDGGGTKYIYVDGGLAEASGVANPINDDDGSKFLLGGMSVAGIPTGALDGALDDVQIYGRALSCAEVNYLFLHPGAEVANLADLNADGHVDGSDLALLLGQWGLCGAAPCSADLDCSGSVDAADLAVLLGGWTG
ncbi:MAG: LamG-like jellyroll fold domain-containing protein [Phycisphaerales bacterium]